MWERKWKSLSHFWLFGDSMDCSLPDSSAHGILQNTEVVSLLSSPGDLPNPGIKQVSYVLRWILYQLSYQGSSHIRDTDHKEGWAPKNCCFQTVVLDNIFGSPLDRQEIKPVNPKGNQSWIFTGIDAEAEAPILWPPYGKSCHIGKGPDAGKDWRQKKWASEHEMVR